MKKNIFLFLFIFGILSPEISKAQFPDTSILKNLIGGSYKQVSLVAGLHYSLYTFAEIGLAKNRFKIYNLHPFASAAFISTEIKLDKKLILGPKTGLWFCGGISALCLGLEIICYTDFKSNTIRLRPQAGIGMRNFKIVYGYNMSLSNKSFEGINKNVLSLLVLFKLKKKGGF